MFQQQTFTHHGLVFCIETEGWADENAARTAISYLRRWAMANGTAETTELYVVLMQEAGRSSRKEILIMKERHFPPCGLHNAMPPEAQLRIVVVGVSCPW